MSGNLYIGTNTKMYKTIRQTTAYLRELAELTADIDRRCMELFVIPSFTALSAAQPIAERGRIRLGAQNMGWETEGQFTGEISPLMLQEVGVSIVEIGHSERRLVFGETDEMANRKVHCALEHGFTPLLCIGETAAQKDLGIADDVLRIQLKKGLHGLTKMQARRLWVAYEPVWAIGVGGLPASSHYAGGRHFVIRDTLRALFGDTADAIPILYGGSVNPENAPELVAQPAIDGLFVGRSAWDPQRFHELIRNVISENAGQKGVTP